MNAWKICVALSGAISKARETPDIDVKVTFDNNADRSHAMLVLLPRLVELELLDLERTEDEETGQVLELLNGSCISLLVA
jgi:hypothetical protein